MSMRRVLILAAHPDDEILGCGGLISRCNSDETTFKVVFLGEGSSCRFIQTNSQEVSNAIQLRTQCAKDALSSLNVFHYEFNDLPCGRFDQVPMLEITKIIESAIVSFMPDTVFTHSSKDANNDHRIVFKSTISATRPGAINHVMKVLSYEVLSSSEWSFNEVFKPNTFIKLSENDIVRKFEALSIYASELKPYPFPRSFEGIRSLAMVRGMQCGYEFAEAFSLVREIV